MVRRRGSVSSYVGLFVLLWLCRSCWAEDDMACLMKFKSSVTDPFNSLARWNATSAEGSVCAWAGVACLNGEVLSLRLPGKGLIGPNFHFSLLYCLISLQELDLSNNGFAGSLPSNMCQQLPFLTRLDLSHNLFTGSTPPDLANCLYLQYLDLSSNALSGPIPSTLTNKSKSLDARFDNNPRLCMSECRPSNLHRNLLLIGASILLAFLLLLMSALVLIAFRWPHKLPPLLKQYLAFRSASHGGNINSSQTHHKVTWEEVQRATSFFSPANIVGSGGSSTVYKGRLLDGQEIAVKVLHKVEEVALQLQTPKQLFITELAFLGKLRHRNLVKVLGFFCDSESMAIILDYMPAGSLDALLRHESATTNLAFGWKARLNILLGIAEGLAYLHNEYDGKQSVIHADLKPANVLLDEYMEAHIADFGIATFVSTINNCSVASISKGQVLPMPCWSLGYTAPECVQQGLVSRKGDVFSFGVIVLEMITGERPSSNKLKEGQSLVEWVSEALGKGGMDNVIAPMLLSAKEMMRWREDLSATLRMGCSCASMARENRPNMYEVVIFLRRICEKLEDNICS